MPRASASSIDPVRAYEECVDALRAFMGGVGFTDAVIGLSGGIDSSLVAAMAVDALGSAAVHGVMLPGPYSSRSSLDDARDLADNLGISCNLMPITTTFEVLGQTFAASCGQSLEGLAAENAQARLRTVFVMALSNQFGWLMLNTGNKSEAAMGYSTLYGDTAGAFAPIGGLYKTEVFAVARWRNEAAFEHGQIAPIPENVLLKPPSAELSDGQTDEASMGIGYEELDSILIAVNEEGRSPSELAAEGFDTGSVQMVLERFEANAFKRAQEPPFADVSRS